MINSCSVTFDHPFYVVVCAQRLSFCFARGNILLFFFLLQSAFEMADMVQSLVGSVGALALGAATATAAYYYMANDDVPQFYYDMKLQTVPVDVSSGVRQGDVLSTKLFCV